MTSHRDPESESVPESEPDAWADDMTREALSRIAEGITELVGFQVAAVSVARDPQTLQVMAVAGSDEAGWTLDGARIPVADLLSELARAEDWGLFKFVPSNLRSSVSVDWVWTPELEPGSGPDAWHPLDLLVAPLYDHDGVLRGLLSIDCPVDGRRPDLPRRRVLERYAAQAARALMLAVERSELAERVRLLSAARDIVRSASSEAATGAELDQVRASLVDSFRARGVWVHVFDTEDLGPEPGPGLEYRLHGESHVLSAPLVASIEAVAVESWSAQRVALIGRRPGDRTQVPPASDADELAMARFMDEVGIGTTMLVPLGAGQECLGVLVLTRGPQDQDWSELEVDTALEIGRDLGRSLLHARVVTRERAALRELQALDEYKSGLITTLSHELKSPLAVMLGNLELLGERRRSGPSVGEEADAEAADAETEIDTILAAVGRGADRLVRVVESLLLLSRVDDPHSPRVAIPVDLEAVVTEVRGLTPLAAQHRLALEVEDPGRVSVVGDPAELETLVGNLVGNAMKYSGDDDPVTVTLTRTSAAEVTLTCADVGIGIADTDRARLFEEFFRSEDGQVRRQAGTGLGLAIVDRIVSRHGGRVDVQSEVGVGTVVRVTLPAA